MSATSTDPSQLDLKLEVVVLGVSDVDRAKAFYEKIGCRVDADHATGDDFRVVQVTPHNSEASIIFGKGITSPRPGSTNSLIFAVDNVDVARNDLIAGGVNVSAVFHYPGGVFRAGEKSRALGRDPERRSYLSFASFEDPDGNGWLLQEIKTRLPGRDWNSTHRAAVERHWTASATGDQDAEHDIYHDDAIVDYP